MARGGKRKGTPGTTYSNRRDLNQPVNFDGGYGEDKPQAALQQNRPRPAPTPMAAPSAPMPGSLGQLNRVSERPNEPLQAGLPTGPGPGPEILGLAALTPVEKLKRMYRANPSPELLELLLLAEG